MVHHYKISFAYKLLFDIIKIISFDMFNFFSDNEADLNTYRGLFRIMPANNQPGLFSHDVRYGQPFELEAVEVIRSINSFDFGKILR